MNKFILILTIVLLGNNLEISGQVSELNRLENLKNIKSTDTLRIDIKKGGCFHGNWQKLIIVREDKKFRFIKIDGVSRLILEYDKKAVLYQQEEIWLRRNLGKVLNSENTVTISINEYISIIDKLIELISTYENCTVNVAGEYSIITIENSDMREKFDFECEIPTDL